MIINLGIKIYMESNECLFLNDYGYIHLFVKLDVCMDIKTESVLIWGNSNKFGLGGENC